MWLSLASTKRAGESGEGRGERRGAILAPVRGDHDVFSLMQVKAWGEVLKIAISLGFLRLYPIKCLLSTNAVGTRGQGGVRAALPSAVHMRGGREEGRIHRAAAHGPGRRRVGGEVLEIAFSLVFNSFFYPFLQ